MNAEEIREYINKKYFEHARKTGAKEITLKAGDIASEIKMSSRQPAVCGAMNGERIQKNYNVKLIGVRTGDNVGQKDKKIKHAREIWYTYEIL